MNMLANLYRLSIRRFGIALKNPIAVFVALASFFGVLIIMLAPPFTGADEEAHFTRAWGIAQGQVILGSEDQIEMPVSYRKSLGCLQSKNIVVGEVYQYKYNEYGEQKSDTIKCLSSLSSSGSEELVATTAAGYSPATYIPQIISIWLGKMFNLPMFAINYLVRLSVLAAYIALIALAIRVMPERKWALVGVALLPYSLIQIINPGGDYMLLGAVAVFVAAVLRSRTQESDLSNKQTRGLLGVATLAAIFMVLPKGIFPGVCFVPLLFFFGRLKSHIITKATLATSVLLVGYMWQKFVFLSGMQLANGSYSIMNLPHAFIKTMFYGWSNRDFLYTGLGTGLDSEVGLPAVAITLMSMLIGVYLFVGYGGSKLRSHLSLLDKQVLVIASIAVAFMVVLGSFAALYIAGVYLQGDGDVIKGVQSRYFYPALILLAMVPYVRAIKTSAKNYATIVLVGSILLQVVHIAALAIRFDWV